MRKPLVCLLVPVLLLALAASSASAASLPKPLDPTVVIPTSLGGVSVGMPEAKARKAWGASRGKCTTSAEFAGCEYGSRETPGGYANIDFSNGKVANVFIYGAEGATGVRTPNAGAAFLAFKTKGGVGISSPLAALKKEFPKGKILGDSTSDYFKFEAAGKGDLEMTFLLINGKVWSFGIDAEPHL